MKAPSSDCFYTGKLINSLVKCLREETWESFLGKNGHKQNPIPPQEIAIFTK